MSALDDDLAGGVCEIMKHVIVGSQSCQDCRMDVTTAPDEVFMLRPSAWRKVNSRPRTRPADWLCVGCVETRLRRRLTRADFDTDPEREGLTNLVGSHSERMLNRLAAGGGA